MKAFAKRHEWKFWTAYWAGIAAFNLAFGNEWLSFVILAAPLAHRAYELDKPKEAVGMDLLVFKWIAQMDQNARFAGTGLIQRTDAQFDYKGNHYTISLRREEKVTEVIDQ